MKPSFTLSVYRGVFANISAANIQPEQDYLSLDMGVLFDV